MIRQQNERYPRFCNEKCPNLVKAEKTFCSQFNKTLDDVRTMLGFTYYKRTNECYKVYGFEQTIKLTILITGSKTCHPECPYHLDGFCTINGGVELEEIEGELIRTEFCRNNNQQ
ncbi:hypothetical protein [Caudoviricetes sp.]|nr:hypothetical protein [Caudoviricetes sp.]